MKAIEHLKTINHHKYLVMQHCFRAGIYWQGLWHDMSKYSPAEFLVGAKYYQGFRSPNNAEREDKGYSSAWLHHKGRNKHHMEYWIDYSLAANGQMEGMKMPSKYVVEMFCDRVAASKTYQREKYTDASAWEYYYKNRGHYMLHPDTEHMLAKLLWLLKENGEDATFAYIRSKRCGWNTLFRTPKAKRRLKKEMKK